MVLAALVGVSPACGDDSAGGNQAVVPPNAPQQPDADVEAPQPDAGPDIAEPPPPTGACDPIMASGCALPWPSNRYLRPDETRVTGFTLGIPSEALPTNNLGDPLKTDAYQRLDGYGVGSALLMLWPNLDASSLPDETRADASLAPDAAILLLRVTEGGLEPTPWWAELDAREDDPEKRALIVRPAVILEEQSRYIVAVRALTRLDGTPVPRSDAFDRLVSGDTIGDPELAGRQARFDDLLDRLEDHGVPRAALTLAWDFVTASSDALHGAMLSMRDQAFELVGPEGPELVIDEVDAYAQTDDGSGLPVDDRVAFRLRGHFEAPDFTLADEGPAGAVYTLRLDPQGTPVNQGTRVADLHILIPHAALEAPADLCLYGHGLLGHGDQTFMGHNQRIAADHNVIFAGTTLVGMSEDDIAAGAAAASDASNFPWLSDHLHQGLLHYVLLARALKWRLPTHPEIQARGIQIQPGADVFYSGISQGGIFGASVVALSPDLPRGHLGVPGSNYSLLLERSSDFAPFVAVIEVSYPQRVHQLIGIGLVQNLWEMTDPVSYYRHLQRAPFPDTPASHVLLAPARGDRQVAVVANDVVARSDLGIPALAGHSRPLQPAHEASFPRQGSGIVFYDFGHPDPPPGNQVPPPFSGELQAHGAPAQADHHNAQMMAFLRTGEIVDVCGGDGCTPD